jgi:hypothetical protein
MATATARLADLLGGPPVPFALSIVSLVTPGTIVIF